MEAELSSSAAKWLAVASWGCGLTAAAVAYSMLSAKLGVESRAEPVRVTLQATARPAAPRAAAPAKEVLPLVGAVDAALPKSVTPNPPVAPEKAPASETPASPAEPQIPAEVPAPQLDLVQPGMAPQQVPSLLLPSIGAPVGAELPPRPAEDAFVSQYTDLPGGQVVVVALLVNHEGDVIDTKLVIPSKFGLKDLGLALAARQQKVHALQPPLRVGEVRWIELRLEYPETNFRESLVP